MGTLNNEYSLLSVVFPDTLKLIGDGSFWGCPRLKGVEIPDAVTLIGGTTFSECDELKSVVIPDGANAFSMCKNLSKVVVLTVAPIDFFTSFIGCPKLRTVILLGVCHTKRWVGVDEGAERKNTCIIFTV